MSEKVAVIFENGLIKPIWFLYAHKKYLIKNINYKWSVTKGISKIYYFTVSDGINNFELCFDDKQLTWKIKLEQYYT